MARLFVVLWSIDGMDTRRLQVISAGLTDVGRARHHNEDNILVRHDLGLFLVSDGMGGHNAGEVASALTAASLRNFFEATRVDEYLPPDNDEVMAGARRLAAAVHKANADVHEISNTHTRHRGMGCTLVVFCVIPPFVHITHLGDSRCYRVRKNKIELLTRDHTLINDILALKPDMSEGELSHLPKNIVTRAIGIDAVVNFDVRTEEIEHNDILLLCSDGLTGMLSDTDILNVIDSIDDPAEAASILIHLANEAGGLDNISAVVVRFDAMAQPLAATVQPPPLTDESSELAAAATEPPAAAIVPAATPSTPTDASPAPPAAAALVIPPSPAPNLGDGSAMPSSAGPPLTPLPAPRSVPPPTNSNPPATSAPASPSVPATPRSPSLPPPPDSTPPSTESVPRLPVSTLTSEVDTPKSSPS